MHISSHSRWYCNGRGFTHTGRIDGERHSSGKREHREYHTNACSIYYANGNPDDNTNSVNAETYGNAGTGDYQVNANPLYYARQGTDPANSANYERHDTAIGAVKLHMIYILGRISRCLAFYAFCFNNSNFLKSST